MGKLLFVLIRRSPGSPPRWGGYGGSKGPIFVRHQQSHWTRVPAAPNPPSPLPSIGYHARFLRPNAASGSLNAPAPHRSH